MSAGFLSYWGHNGNVGRCDVLDPLVIFVLFHVFLQMCVAVLSGLNEGMLMVILKNNFLKINF